MNTMSVEEACRIYGARAVGDGHRAGSKMWEVHSCGNALAVILTGSTQVEEQTRAHDACFTFGRLAFMVSTADAFRHAQAWADSSITIDLGRALEELRGAT